MPQRILVTGGLGYIGSIACEHLVAAGHTVTALDNVMYGNEQGLRHLCAHERFDFIRGDVRDESAMRSAVANADTIIHLAAIVGAPACQRDPQAATSINLESVRLLDRLRSNNQLVIYPNTNSGYGATTGKEECTEDSPIQPLSLYGQTKCEAERVVLNRPNSVALRLATVFGMSPRMRLDLLVNHFVHAAITDGYLVLFEKDFKRNFVHVRDVADCFLHCINNGVKMQGRAYNLGLDSANLSKEELALAVQRQVPRFYLHFAPIGQDPDKRNYIVSSMRLKDAGFVARRSLDAGIAELLKGYRMEGRAACKNVA